MGWKIMIEILPNWHPIFVHFTVALLTMSVVFYVFHLVLPSEHRQQHAIVLLAQVNLWIGTSFAVITAIAGWFAYNSVAHDTPSHAAMTEHRNWALVTLAVFFLLTLWSIAFRKRKKAPVFFVIILLLAGGLLTSTAWHGAESVYRYGLGVMSIPKSSGEGHAHQHPDGEDHADTAKTQTEATGAAPHDTKNHPHDDASSLKNEQNNVTNQSTMIDDTQKNKSANSLDDNPLNMTGDKPEETSSNSSINDQSDAIIDDKKASSTQSDKKSHPHDTTPHAH
jgi:uncharacterized membrane protein